MNPSPIALVTDQIEFLVPTRRGIPPGWYVGTVTEVLPLAHRPGAKQRYKVDIEFQGGSRSILISIPPDPKLRGYLFLGSDRHPTPYRWMPNIETRLKLSIDSSLAAKGTTAGG